MRDSERYPVGGSAAPNTEPHGNYQEDNHGRERQDCMIIYLIEGKEKGFPKPVYCDRIQWVTQGVDENPIVFQCQLVETIHDYTNLGLTTPEGVTILNLHFINQSAAPDICQKLTKMALGPQTPTQYLLEVATGAFNNRDIAVRQEQEEG